jgi:dienelactone hydrolase
MSTTSETANRGEETASAARPFFKNRFVELAPGPRAWTGAAIGALVAGVVSALAQIGDLQIGIGLLQDLSLAIVAGAVVVLLCALAVLVVAWLLRKVPLRVIAAIGGACLAIVVSQLAVANSVEPRFWIIGALIPLEALTGLGAGAVLGRELRDARISKKIGGYGLFFGMLAANVGLAAWLLAPGTDHHLRPSQAAAHSVAALALADPGDRGPFRVKTLSYGSRVGSRRSEFASAAELVTEPVDATPLLPAAAGVGQSARNWFWGFDAKQFPVNGQTWYPEGVGPFPLVLVVHGNHSMEEFSDPGYAYLCDHLASHGFIAVSVDENFLNATWSGDLGGAEMPARAWMLLAHFKQWKLWNASAGNPFFGKVDFDKLALVGHSRGGEAAAVAALFNRLSHDPDNAGFAFDCGFSIRAIVALAPSEGFYKPSGDSVWLKDVDYLVIQGAHDADVSTFRGIRQYQHVLFHDGQSHFKCALYVDRANHGQFNTVWGIRDWPAPIHYLQNVKPLSSGEEQRRIATVYITAFLDAALRGNRQWLPMFRDPRTAAQWLPSATFAARYSDSTFEPVSNFEEDFDPATTTMHGGTETAHGMHEWREEQVPLRDGENQANKAVFLKWKRSDNAKETADYTISLPDDLPLAKPLSGKAHLQFALAPAAESDGPIAAALRLESSDGSSAQLALEQIDPPIHVQISKLAWLEQQYLRPFEVVLRTHDLALADFQKANPRLDVSHLKKVVFVFDRRQEGSVYLDDIGFATPAAAGSQK